MSEQTGFRLIKPENAEMKATTAEQETAIEIQIPESVGKKKVAPKLRSWIKKADTEDIDGRVAVTVKTTNVSAIDAQFTIKGMLAEGQYELLLDYEKESGEMATAKLPLKITASTGSPSTDMSIRK